MDTSTPRFSSPLALPRPRGSRLLQAFSPSLARSVRFSNRVAFEHWIWLEASTHVRTFWERPIRARLQTDSVVLDFWVRTQEDEHFVVLVPGDHNPHWPSMIQGIPIEQVTLPDRTAYALLVKNWLRILGAINAVRGSIATSLINEVAGYIVEPMSLARIESQFAQIETSCGRGAIYELIRTGRCVAPSLAVAEL